MELEIKISSATHPEVDYGYFYDCASKGCADEGICRCGTITVNGISNIYVNANDVVVNYKPSSTSLSTDLVYNANEFDLYVLECLLYVHDINDPSNWDALVEGGYYGDELGDVVCTIPKNMILSIEANFLLHKDLDRFNHLTKCILGIDMPFEVTNVDINNLKLDSIIIPEGFKEIPQHEYSADSPIGIVDSGGVLLTEHSLSIINDKKNTGLQNARFIQVS